MLDQADKALRQWAEEIAGPGTVVLGPPDAVERPNAVGLWLLEVIPQRPPRTARQPRLEVLLRYLVTAAAASPEDAHALLGKLLFAALENPDLELEFEPPSLLLWRALGIAPRPAFVVQRRLSKDLPAKVVKTVRESRFEISHLRQLRGVVVGRDGHGLAAAEIEVPAFSVSTRTDANGRFQLPRVPVSPEAAPLMVRAAGMEQTIDVASQEVNEDGLVIHFDRQE